ncbi:MAG: SLC13 family permease [Myxococcota bacterium]
MTVTVIIFAIVYLGMMLGTLPWMKVDRPAIALLGAIAMLASGAVTTDEAKGAINGETLGLLFGLMIVAASFDLSGMYSEWSDRLERLDLGPRGFLAVVVVASGAASAILTNDVIAVAFAPVLLGLCIRRKLNPLPFLLALAFSANAGSIATIIGNPQNMLIGQHFDLSFVGYMGYAAAPAVLSLGLVWAIISWCYRGRWTLPERIQAKPLKIRKFDRWEAWKATFVTVVVVVIFIVTDWPRELVALSAGGVLLANARFASRRILHRVDWQLLVLFMGLFVVNAAFQQTGLPKSWIASLQSQGVHLDGMWTLYVSTAVLSDIVSNVPAVMLLLPVIDDPASGPVMAIASGLSGNFIVVGSIACMIVVNTAEKRGVRISAAEFARSGVPVTIATMAVAALWLWGTSAA